MQIPCPSCKAVFAVKPPKPGRYTPKCPKCAAPFVMIVPAEEGQTVQVRPMPPKKGDPEATAPPAPDEVTEATSAQVPRPQDADRTAAVPSGVDATTDLGSESAKPPAARQQLPDQLGGYEVVRKLGAGGMGAVYLARQVSLDRPVALKVIHPDWAGDPVFLARFCREAYAAAQLNHHNVVQIYDLGADAGVNFFSMEFVEGKSLGDLLKKSGQLDPAAAVGYALQAARGLKFAHDRGMVHRDVKPDNLMVNDDGVVKVADLGLVKTRGMTPADDAGTSEQPAARPGGSRLQSVSHGVTHAGTAMGSPSYMAPEQARDAASVDPRADVYSLGCSLYALLSGRTPFQGKTAVEVISKALTEPPPPLSSVAKHVPKGLSDIVDRTLAKSPDDRYQSMDELIAALKTWQDEQAAGPPRPTGEQAAAFEHLTAKVSPPASGVVFVAAAAVGVVAGLGLLAVSPTAGGAVLVAAVAALASGFVAVALFTDSPVGRKAREWAFGARVMDWVTGAAAVVLFFAGLYLAGVLVGGLIGLVLGVGVGLGYGFLVARPASNKRAELRGEFEKVLKRLRLAGMDEDAVRAFVVQAAGPKWPAVYELLFGYDAARQAAAGKPEAASGLRDVLVRRFDAAVQARKQAKAKRHLRALEQKRLEAEGASPADARARAADAADDLVEQAAELRAANADRTKKVNVRAVLTRYERAKLQELRRPRKPAAAVLVNKFVGALLDPRLRVLAGALLIVGGLLWARQNATALAGVEAAAGGASGVESAGQAKQLAASALAAFVKAEKGLKPLSVSFLPEAVTGLFDSVNPLVAGLLLILSAFAANGWAVLGAALGAAVVLAGHKLGVPEVGPLKPNHVTVALGGAVGVLSLVLLRGR